VKMKKLLSILLIIACLVAVLPLGNAVLADALISTVAEAGSDVGIRLPSQHGAFYAEGRYWIFYLDTNDDLSYKTSTDGSSWSSATKIADLPYTAGAFFDVVYDGAYVHYVRNLDYDSGEHLGIAYRRGAPQSDGSVTWSTVEQTALVDTEGAFDIQLAIDSNGYAWVGYGNDNIHPTVIKSSTNDGTWSTAAGFPYTFFETTYWLVIPIAQTSGKVYCIVYRTLTSEDTIRGYQWDGSSWESQQVATSSLLSNPTGDGYYGMLSAVAINDDIHLVFMDSGEDIMYAARIAGSWGAEATVEDTIVADYSSPVLTKRISGDLICCWLHSDDKSYYKNYSEGSWDASATELTDESVNEFTSERCLQAYYEEYETGPAFVLVYQTGTSGLLGYDIVHVITFALPEAECQAASNIGSTTARINGKISDDGGDDCEARFRYSPKGLVGHWKLNEDPAIHDTEIVDSSFHGNDGALSTGDGEADKSVAGKINTAIDFDGTDDYIRVPYNISLYCGSQMTVSFWVKSGKTDYAANAYVVSMWNFAENKRMWGAYIPAASDYWSWVVSPDGGSANAKVWGTDTAITSNWEHIIFVWDNVTKSISFYKDGGWIGDGSFSVSYINQESWLEIGGLAGGNAFDGLIDDVRIYNRALTEAEILALYNEGNGTEAGAETTEWQNSLVTDSEYYEDIADLTPGTEYEFQTQAKNSAGEGEWSESAYFLTCPAAPTNVAATDGDHTDKVVVTWTKSDGATGYKVYEGVNLLDTLGDVATYDDTSAPAPTITPGSTVATDGDSTAHVALSLSGTSASNGASRTYKVVAFNDAGDSPDSDTDTGYRGVGELSYQWQRSASDADADYGNIDGATSATHNDTEAPAPTITPGSTVATDGDSTAHVVLSLSGTSTSEGAGRYYQCVLNADGAAQQISGSNRGHRAVGELTYQWQRSSGDADEDYSNIDGATISTYNDTDAPAPTITPGSTVATDGDLTAHVSLSLNGTSTSDGAGRYYKCVLNADGAVEQTSASNRGYRTVGALTYQWQRSATDSDDNYSNIDGATSTTYDDTDAPAPTITHGSVTATDGSFTDKVALNNSGASANVGDGRHYQCVLDAEGAAQQTSASDRGYRGVGELTYQWYRSESDGDSNYSVIEGATGSTYDDTDAPAPTITPGSASVSDGDYEAYVAMNVTGQTGNNGAGRYYKCWHTAEGVTPSYTGTDRGYRGIGELTYQWQRSADDSDADYSNLDGATNTTYDDYGAPEGCVGRYYRGVINATGAAQQISSSDRGYRLSYLAPAVTSSNATDIEMIRATLYGDVTAMGGLAITERGFEWGVSSGNYSTNWTAEGIFGLGEFNHIIESLSVNITYYWRAFAINDGDLIGYSEERFFVTLLLQLPLAPTNLVATQVGLDAANITWANGYLAVNTIIRIKEGSYPESPTDGGDIYDGTGNSTTYWGLDLDTKTYYISAWSENAMGYSIDYAQAKIGGNMQAIYMFGLLFFVAIGFIALYLWKREMWLGIAAGTVWVATAIYAWVGYEAPTPAMTTMWFGLGWLFLAIGLALLVAPLSWNKTKDEIWEESMDPDTGEPIMEEYKNGNKTGQTRPLTDLEMTERQQPQEKRRRDKSSKFSREGRL